MFLDVTGARVLDETSDGIREIYGYWDQCRSNRAIPSRTEFDPVSLPRHMPGFLLIDVLIEAPEGAETVTALYRYRVVGEWEISARGHNPMGKLVNEGFHASSLETALAIYDHVRISKLPAYELLDFVNDHNRHVREHSIVLPLTKDGSTVGQMLVYSEPV